MYTIDWGKWVVVITFILLTSRGIAQNTIGLISFDPATTHAGYNLLYPNNQSTVYLLNTCGKIVHQWTDEPDFRPGNVVYLLGNGNILKTKNLFMDQTPSFGAGGAGGTIELRDWDNSILWSTTIMDTAIRAHHDIAPMPNGNVLIIAWERKAITQIFEAGRDTAFFSNDELWPDFIVEMDPIGDSVVWKWHAWDHLIQDFDSLRQNFGAVSEHPELIDINYDIKGFGGRNDWMHTNSIDYNEELDQIMLCVPHFGEIWIIDHSTTKEEAAGHTGGNSGRGGDLLFRWGNSRTYKNGNEDDQKLFFQHDAQWNDNFLSSDHAYYGSISVFNNRAGANYSTVNIIKPEWDDDSNSYQKFNGKYLPEGFDKTIIHPDTFPMYSSGLSGVQVLENENILITAGRTGYTFELTPQNEIVWEYITPLRNGAPVNQGTTLITNENITFRTKRYPLDFPAFSDKDLSTKGYIELNPDTSFCLDISTQTLEMHPDHSSINVIPNPVSDIFSIQYTGRPYFSISIYDIFGRKIFHNDMIPENSEMSASDLGMETGFYVLVIDEKIVRKIVVSGL